MTYDFVGMRLRGSHKHFRRKSETINRASAATRYDTALSEPAIFGRTTDVVTMTAWAMHAAGHSSSLKALH